MNYYLIWTDKGWIKSPIYNHPICRRAVNEIVTHDNVNITYNIHCAYRFNDNQIKEALEFLQAFGVASWAVECKEDFLKEVLEKLKKKCDRSN